MFIVATYTFAEILEEVHEGNTLLIDNAILRYINQTATPFWDQFFLFITQLGGIIGVLVITFLIVGLLVKKKHYVRGVFVVTSVGGASLITVLVKLLVGRERPALWEQLITEASYSFPSGHATASSALAFSLVIASWQTRWRWLIVSVGFIYTILVGYSRMYLGVHYPTDIIAAWTMSLAWVITTASLTYGYIWRRRHTRKR